MKRFIRSALRPVCFLVLLALILIYVNGILKLKQIDAYSMTKFYEQPKDSVDVLILGSSHAFENFNTGTLWDEHGIAAYDLGGSVQPFWNTYYYLKEALKTQHPKLIILEGTQALHYSDYSEEYKIIMNNYSLRWSADKARSLKASIPPGELGDYLPEYIRYHNRYPELSGKDFRKDQGDPFFYDWKGFECNMDIRTIEGNDVSDVTEIGYMSPKSEDYYKRIIDLAKENGIPIEVIVAPYADCYDEEQKVFNRAQEIAEEKDVPFLNCNLILDEIGIDYETDAADSDHLNHRGNQKFSRYIGDHICAEYDIPDRRGDSAYDSWARQADHIRRMIDDQKFCECHWLDEYLDIIMGPEMEDYECFISFDGLEGDAEELIGMISEKTGIDYDGTDTVWYIRDHELVWRPDAENDRYFIESAGNDTGLFSIRGKDGVTENTIVIDSEEYKSVPKGVNIVIYDEITSKVADSVGFEAVRDFRAERR